MAGNIRVPISFETLLDSMSELSLEDKTLLRDSLDEQIEAVTQEDSQDEAEVREARDAYEKGHYISVDEYIARRRRGT